MRWMILVCLVTLGFAGCAEDAAPVEDDSPDLDVTSTTGGIRGVVVDQAITPIQGALVTLLPSGKTTESDEGGLFSFTGLDPGTYFLTVEKLLYEGVQASAEVKAGVANPPIVNIQITRIAGLNPYIEPVQFDGFYECAFALVFITDSCDMAARTAHDAGADPVPRSIQRNVNTILHPYTDSAHTIIQEGFWDESATQKMWMMVDSTPIDNGCDCSDHTYVTAQGEGPTYGRADRPDEVSAPGNWPEAGSDVAIRGFVPFTSGPTEVAYAVDVEFQIFTHFFHNYKAPEGWNILEKDQFPIPE